MADYIRISGAFEGEAIDPKRPMNEDEAMAVGNVLAADATYGTFAEFSSEYWTDKLIEGVEKLAKPKIYVRSLEKGQFGFHLDVDSSLFDCRVGGIQHLLGILAGDLFTLELQGLRLQKIRVEEVEFPGPWRQSILSTYRDNRAHKIQEIRTAFQLEADQPLLAFSVKPRMGLKHEALKEITLSVLKAGFHIVELDTRNLDLNEGTVQRLLDLAKQAADAGGGRTITRFSPNISVHSSLAIDLVNRFRDVSADPVVIKIDGGLDGISTIQQVRAAFGKKEQHRDTPFITTYPLLRRTMQDRTGQDTFLNALVWSGSDIVYPGGAPNLGGTYRHLDHADALTKSVNRYLNFISTGEPMPTIAGGVYPGQLQAYYELLGPDVAFFLGGGVALHQDGPIEGAKLCAQILQKARDARQEANKGEFAQDIPKKLIEAAEGAYAVPSGADPDTFKYISPQVDLRHAPGLKPWFSK